MRIRLKGINSITKRLANGTTRTYWYAWKGGPPLSGEPGTPEFIASYNAAVAQKVAPPYLRLAMLLAINTGQRQGDLLRLPWSAYDGKAIKLRQKKTGAYVPIPVADVLKTALDAAPRQSPIMLTNSGGKPWSESGFQ